MYAVGETFYYEIFDEEYELHVIGDIILGGKEYIIAEDFEGEKRAFLFDENEEDVVLIEDDDALEIIGHWEEEYFGTGADIGDWDEDGYYDREDSFAVSSGDEEESYIEDNYIEEEDSFDEYEEDVDSFITGLMEK
jgi:DNA-directed RNA polymerase subunit delta